MPSNNDTAFIAEDSWCRHLPDLHRTLADPTFCSRLPPVTAKLDLFDSCALWETLHYLLTHIVGWDSVGKGLGWWYREGQPIDQSAALALMKRHWGHFDCLDFYAAWAWSCERNYEERQDSSPAAFAKATSQTDEGWWRRFLARQRHLDHDPFYGGGNSLHLGHSSNVGDTVGSRGSRSLAFDVATRRATLIVSGFGSWRSDLAHEAAALPQIGDRSWHVEVFDRQVGYLGLYRQSRVTHRWFAGPHSIHTRGNSPHQQID